MFLHGTLQAHSKVPYPTAKEIRSCSRSQLCRMPVICIGPVCIPAHMILAFLVGLAHQYGYLKWFKQEWVTWRFWKAKIWGPPPAKQAQGRSTNSDSSAKTDTGKPAVNGRSSSATAGSQAGGDSSSKASSAAAGAGAASLGGQQAAQEAPSGGEAQLRQRGAAGAGAASKGGDSRSSKVQ